MCGRYASFLPAEALARTFGTVNPLPNFERTWNMAPTRDAPVIRLARDGQRYLDALKWGLVPYFTKDPKKARRPINARSETVATSGMFREVFARRRCLVPAPVYYEWRDDPDGSKSPEGDRLLAPIQDRMPVIIERADWPLWLDEANGDAAPLLRPAAEGVLPGRQEGG